MTQTATPRSTVPVWRPNTAYVGGAMVVAPTGALVIARTSFTSTPAYSAGDWESPVSPTAQSQKMIGLAIALGGI